MPEPVLDTSSLRFHYPYSSSNGNFAFHDLHLSVPRGSIYGLLGPNGSGKSTLLQLAMGILTAGSGQLRVLGIDPASDPIRIRRRVGYVPQKSDLDPEMTVDETLDFVSLFFADRWNREVVKEALDRFQLAHRGGEKVGHLSAGFQQRLSLVTALAIEPEVLILDEPTAGLDAVVRRHFAAAVIDYMATAEGRTVVLSSHQLSEMEALVDHVGILGRVGPGASGESRQTHVKAFQLGIQPTWRNTLVEAPLEVLKERALIARARCADSFENLDCSRCLLRITGSQPVTAVFWLDEGSQRQSVLDELEAAGVEDLRIGESSLDEIFVALAQEPSLFQRNLPAAADSEEGRCRHD